MRAPRNVLEGYQGARGFFRKTEAQEGRQQEAQPWHLQTTHPAPEGGNTTTLNNPSPPQYFLYGEVSLPNKDNVLM